MPCYYPLEGWRSCERNSSGKRSIVFNQREGLPGSPVVIPCGRCLGCRLERSRQWAMRCMHEASLWDRNCFVTLTYDDESVPKTPDGLLTLEPRDMVLFLKRLREANDGKRIRFLQCGEYGDSTLRPHHHLLLFNHDFDDKRLCNPNSRGDARWRSESLDRMWGLGQCMLGSLSFQSASYVARYSMKKVYGDKAEAWYQGRVPEYMTMSRRPGIARDWWDKFGSEVALHDSVIVNGSEVKPPKFYDNVLEGLTPELSAGIKSARKREARKSVDNTPQRLRVREEVKKAKLYNLKRSL